MEQKKISQTDYEVIEQIAEKNNMSIKELANYLISKNGKYPMPQILLTSEERDLIDERAKKLNYSRSRYCLMCWQKAVEKKLYKNIDFSKLQKRKYGEDTRKIVAIYFKDEDAYAELRNIAENLGVSVSSLIRYFALNTELI